MRTDADPKDPLPFTLPPLYKKDARSGVVIWQISVVPEGDAAVVRKVWGKVGGKQQQADDLIKEGKRAGTTAATSAHGQAILEAKAEWERQQARGGYGTDPEGGESAAKRAIAPMLAHDFADYKGKVKSDKMFMQPKLDGHRCLAHIKADSVVLKSRKGEDIVTMPHIVEELHRIRSAVLASGFEYVVLDGELFTMQVRFQTIQSLITKKKVNEDEEKRRSLVQYFIYDVLVPAKQNELLYELRLALFRKWLQGYQPDSVLSPVHTLLCTELAHVEDFGQECVAAGYEGGMLRLNNPYEPGKRSKSLLKVKTFLEEEFKVIAVRAGEGTFRQCAVFTVQLPNGNTTDMTSPGTMDEKQAYLLHPETALGKSLTVKYFGYTDDQRLRFPVAKAFRAD